MQDINLYHLLQFYAKKWIWFVSLAIIGGVAGYLYSSYIQTPLYKSDATLLIVSADSESSTKNTTLINNYVALLKSRRVLDPVISEHGAGITYDELAGSTTATNDKNTEVIKLSISSKSAETSQQLVDGVVESFKNEVKNLYNLENVSVVDNANRATEPYNIRTVLTSVLLAAAGPIAAAIALFFVYDFNLGRPGKVVKKATKKPAAKSKTSKQGKIRTALQSARSKATALFARPNQPEAQPAPAPVKKTLAKKRTTKATKPAAKKPAASKSKSTTTKTAKTSSPRKK